MVGDVSTRRVIFFSFSFFCELRKRHTRVETFRRNRKERYGCSNNLAWNLYVSMEEVVSSIVSKALPTMACENACVQPRFPNTSR